MARQKKKTVISAPALDPPILPEPEEIHDSDEVQPEHIGTKRKGMRKNQPDIDKKEVEATTRPVRSKKARDATTAQPKARRTSAEVQADKAAAEAEKQLEAEKREQRMARLKGMELQLRAAKDAERENVERRGYDLSVVEEGEEHINEIPLAGDSSVEQISEAQETPAVDQGRGRSRGRGRGRGRARGGKASCTRGQSKVNVVEKLEDESEGNHHGKHAKPFPTGLHPGFKSSGSRPPHLETQSSTEQGTGGLNDSDVEDPSGRPKTTRKHDELARAVVGFTGKTSSLPKRPSSQSQASTTKPKSDQTEAPATEVIGEVVRAKPKALSQLRKDDLPEFIKTAWDPAFIHTLRLYLCSANDPLNIRRDVNFQDTVQNLVNRLFPSISYKVSLVNEPILELSYFNNNDNYQDQPDSIQKYCQWALRDDGPALYRKPTPSSTVVKPGDEGYQYPDGLFESDFIVETMKKVAMLVKFSKVDFGNPVGGVAMVAAAVERAFEHFAKCDIDDTNPEKNFSAENYGASVREYTEYLEDFSSNQWARLMELYKFQLKPIAPETITKALGRRKLFVPSSPVKPTTS
ncbi:hypothetical protein PM082_017726 [Marasmius tenuissimus]|nr:hypothetical protein PM082_017726 [Marasmius tenuissimus]